MSKKLFVLAPTVLLAGALMASCGRGGESSTSTGTTSTGTTSSSSKTSSSESSSSSSTQQVYTVTFTVDGETYSSAEVNEGEKVARPEADPTKEDTETIHFEFDDWYLGETAWNFEDAVTGDMTLAAVFDEYSIFTITWMNDEETFKTDKVIEGEAIVAPTEDPTKTAPGYSYEFQGWTATAGGETVIADFGTASKDATYYAVYEENIENYKATVHFDYEGAPEDVEISYTIENREAKLNAIKALLPEEDSMNMYKFESLPEELPLETGAVYNVVKAEKSIAPTFVGGDIEGTAFKNRSGAGTYTAEDGVFSTPLDSVAGNNAVHTAYNYEYFEMNFDAKFETTSAQGRFTITMGVKNYDDIIGFNTDTNGKGFMGAVMIDRKDGGTIKFSKNGTDETVAAASTVPGFTAGFAHFTIKVDQKGTKIAVNGEILVNTDAKPGMGKIVLTRADYTGTLSLKNLTVVATDGEVASKSFTETFENGLGDHMGWVNPNPTNPDALDTSAKNLTITGHKSSFAYTQDSFDNFETTFDMKVSGGQQGRFVFTISDKATDASVGYCDGRSDVNGRVSFYFMLNGANKTIFFLNNDAARTGKDGSGVVSKDFTCSAASVSCVENPATVKIKYLDGKVSVSVNGNDLYVDQALSYKLTNAKLVWAGLSSSGATTVLDNVTVTDLDD